LEFANQFGAGDKLTFFEKRNVSMFFEKGSVSMVLKHEKFIHLFQKCITIGRWYERDIRDGILQNL